MNEWKEEEVGTAEEGVVLVAGDGAGLARVGGAESEREDGLKALLEPGTLGSIRNSRVGLEENVFQLEEERLLGRGRDTLLDLGWMRGEEGRRREENRKRREQRMGEERERGEERREERREDGQGTEPE